MIRSKACLTGVCVLSLWSFHGAEAAPLDALRSVWILQDSVMSANPAHFAEFRQTHTRLEFGHHAVAHSRVGESETQTLAGSQRVRLGRGTFEISFKNLGTDLLFEPGDNLLSSWPHGAGRLTLSYGTRLSDRVDAGARAEANPTAEIKSGTLGARLKPWSGWLAGAYVHAATAGRSSQLDLDNEELVAESTGSYREGGFTLQGLIARRSSVTLRGMQGLIRPGAQQVGYALRASGQTRSFGGSWTTRITRGLAVVADVRYRTMQVDPDGRLDDRQFLRSKLDYTDVGGSVWLRRIGAGRDQRDIGLFLNRGTSTLRRGKLESWAFVNSVATLLGGKDWTGSGQGDLRIVGTAIRLNKNGRSWALRTDSRLFSARGDVDGVMRERAKFDFSTLLFPKTHRESGSIQVEAVDLGLSFGYRLADWGAYYEFAQIIPLRVRSSFEIDGTGGEGSGGSQHRIQLIMHPRMLR